MGYGFSLILIKRGLESWRFVSSFINSDRFGIRRQTKFRNRIFDALCDIDVVETLLREVGRVFRSRSLAKLALWRHEEFTAGTCTKTTKYIPITKVLKWFEPRNWSPVLHCRCRGHWGPWLMFRWQHLRVRVGHGWVASWGRHFGAICIRWTHAFQIHESQKDIFECQS